MALTTLQSFGALIPTNLLGEDNAVLRRVFEDFGRSAEVPHVMSVNTTFTVVAVLFSGAPGRLIHEHVKDETVLVQVQTLQVEVQIGAC